MTLKNKLNRLKNHLVSSEEKATFANEAKEQKIEQKGTSAQLDIPYIADWTAMQATPFYFENDYSIIREVSYPLDYVHGTHRFRELFDVINLWEETCIEHPLSFANLEPSKMLFFDTETTGLGGGVGNTIFLIGYAQVFTDHVVVKQHFLPNPSSEVAMYQGFLTDINDYQSMKLTTYNGKSFDWPQIKTRHTLIRDAVPALPPFGHFDLLHAARRLWKHKLPSVRLSIVEKEILAILRESDVPGYLAPMLYFDFLKDKDPKGLKGVFVHNEIDVLSLITLYIHISEKLLNVSTLTISVEEKYEVARWYEAVGQLKTAIYLYEDLAESEHLMTDQAKKALALLYKKNKQYEKATQICLNLLEKKSTVDVEIATELSKLYEHQWKDYEKALYYATLGYNGWKEKKKLIRTAENKEKVELQKRVERLERKIIV